MAYGNHALDLPLVEPWSQDRNDEHPVQWSPADGGEARYLTIEAAVQRLVRYYDDEPTRIESVLRSGRSLRTPFAFYQLT